MPIWKFGFKHHPIAQWDSAREGCGRSRVQSPVSPMIFFFPQILHLSKSQITFVIVGSNPIFPHTKWVKTLVKIFKNEIFQKMLRIFWFIQKIENLKVNFSPYKMGQNTCKNFQKWKIRFDLGQRETKISELLGVPGIPEMHGTWDWYIPSGLSFYISMGSSVR